MLGKRPEKIRDEVLVTFTNVRIRDMVASYASNLANYKKASSPINFRLEIPDYLRGVFRTLESHGHSMRERFGPGFRRHIKYDDSKKTLVMDVCKPNETKWIRVDHEFAQSELQLLKPNSDSARERLGCQTSNSGSQSSASFASAASHWDTSSDIGGGGRNNQNEDTAAEPQPTNTPQSPSKPGCSWGNRCR